MSEYPKELRPVLAAIETNGDLGPESWSEVVFYDDENEAWESYAGSDTFADGERVVRWVYADEALAAPALRDAAKDGADVLHHLMQALAANRNFWEFYDPSQIEEAHAALCAALASARPPAEDPS